MDRLIGRQIQRQKEKNREIRNKQTQKKNRNKKITYVSKWKNGWS